MAQFSVEITRLPGSVPGGNQQLSGIDVQMLPSGPVQTVRLVPENRALDHEVTDGVLRFTVPTVRGHQMVEIAYTDLAR